MADRKYKIITPHSEENPELLDPDNSNGGPLAAYTTEESAVFDLYKKERDPFTYKPREGETVVYEYIYIPETD